LFYFHDIYGYLWISWYLRILVDCDYLFDGDDGREDRFKNNGLCVCLWQVLV